MEMLAAIDKDATKLDIDEKLEAMNHQMEDISQKIEARAQVGARPLPTLQRTLEQCEVAIHELQHKRQILQHMPYPMGDVAAMSEKAILGKKIMDWAFARLTEPAAESFFRPNAMFPVPPQIKCLRYTTPNSPSLSQK